MKLRNKKTGEIVEATDFNIISEYNSLAELNADWEDYEEPINPYWFINDLDGEPMKCDLKNCGKSNFISWGKLRKQIGNYFETREEAEKAVEKLKALKRLKDKGFKFIGVRTLGKVIDYDIPAPYNRVGFHDINDKDTKEFYDDLRLLFGH